jgi:hypothetical protein
MAKEAGFDADAKAVEEAMELGVVQLARQIAADRSDPKANFTALVDLYDRQPKLGTRTSTSMRDQAFSTPVPLAYVASRLAEIGPETTVYEPTAGQRRAADRGRSGKDDVANEINETRAANLKSQGFKVTQEMRPAHRPRARQRRGDRQPPVWCGAAGGRERRSSTCPTSKRATKPRRSTTPLRCGPAGDADNGRAVLIIGGLNKLPPAPKPGRTPTTPRPKESFSKPSTTL